MVQLMLEMWALTTAHTQQASTLHLKHVQQHGQGLRAAVSVQAIVTASVLQSTQFQQHCQGLMRLQGIGTASYACSGCVTLMAGRSAGCVGI